MDWLRRPGCLFKFSLYGLYVPDILTVSGGQFVGTGVMQAVFDSLRMSVVETSRRTEAFSVAAAIICTELSEFGDNL